ncbi:MAG: Crp/Fnr family transcriptional regulator [bacterium]
MRSARERLKELMVKYPAIAFKVMDELSGRPEKAENRIEDISLSSVAKRIAGALLELPVGKQEILPPITKGDLALQLGMTRETLSRKPAALQKEGLILLMGHRKIIIRDSRSWRKSALLNNHNHLCRPSHITGKLPVCAGISPADICRAVWRLQYPAVPFARRLNN